MKVNIKDVADGKLNGEMVWICDLRYGRGEKPIRHIRPTKAVVRCNSKANKRIFWSESHFAKVGKKGKVLKNSIAPYDTTGYRTMTGNPVYVFTKKQECVDCYMGLSDRLNGYNSVHVKPEKYGKYVVMTHDKFYELGIYSAKGWSVIGNKNAKARFWQKLPAIDLFDMKFPDEKPVTEQSQNNTFNNDGAIVLNQGVTSIKEQTFYF